MCFGKRQKDNFAEDNKPAPSSTSQPEKPNEPTSTTPAVQPTMAPKIAIVIYSMYGHIAKGTCLYALG